VLEPATNQPDPENKFFASPFEAAELEVWNRNPTASILIDREDVEITEPIIEQVERRKKINWKHIEEKYQLFMEEVFPEELGEPFGFELTLKHEGLAGSSLDKEYDQVLELRMEANKLAAKLHKKLKSYAGKGERKS